MVVCGGAAGATGAAVPCAAALILPLVQEVPPATAMNTGLPEAGQIANCVPALLQIMVPGVQEMAPEGADRAIWTARETSVEDVMFAKGWRGNAVAPNARARWTRAIANMSSDLICVMWIVKL